jgi:hypothetical protein
MTWDELARDAKEENKRDRDRLIGLYIGVLAVLLAICAMGGNNAAKEATLKNIEASNTWAFFQAKNMRRHVLRLQVDHLETLLETQPGLPLATREAIGSRILGYKEQDKLLTSERELPKDNREGLDELFEKGKRLEAERDRALKRDPYFDYGEALLQIAIVLASVAIITGGSAPLLASGLVGALGALATLNGFTLVASIPLVG